MRPLSSPVLSLIATLGILVAMADQPWPAGAQSDSAYQRGEPGWPSLKVMEPRDRARYSHGETQGVPVSFQVHGGKLFRNGFRVAVITNGRRIIRTDETPFHVPQLAAGSHHIRFELLDRRGELVPGGTSVQERTFHVGSNRPATAKRNPRADQHVSIAPRSYLPPTREKPSTKPNTTRQQGFTIRSGGRREGPVPRLEAPTSNETLVQSAAKELNRPGNAVLPPAQTPSPMRTPSLSTPPPTQERRGPSPAPSAATPSNTISESMRRNLEETGRRIRPTPESKDDDRFVTIQADTPGTSSVSREGNR